MFLVLWTRKIHTLLRRSIEGPPPSIQRDEHKLKRKFASAILMQRSLRALSCIVHLQEIQLKDIPARMQKPYILVLWNTPRFSFKTQRSEIFISMNIRALSRLRFPFIRPLWVSAFLMRTLAVLLVSRVLALCLRTETSLSWRSVGNKRSFAPLCVTF